MWFAVYQVLLLFLQEEQKTEDTNEDGTMMWG